MARTRSIKPSFFKNEYLAECEPMARLLFVGLWTLADSQGRMEFRPLRIKAELFPYENCDILGLLKQLADRGFVRAYESGDMKVLEIPTFGEHQRCHPDERDEGLPPADESAETIVFPERNAKPGNPTMKPGNPPASCAFNPSTFSPSTLNPLGAPSTPQRRRCSKPADPLRWSAESGWEGITDADHAIQLKAFILKLRQITYYSTQPMTRNAPTLACGINNVGKLTTVISQAQTWCGHVSLDGGRCLSVCGPNGCTCRPPSPPTKKNHHCGPGTWFRGLIARTQYRRVDLPGPIPQ